MGRVAATVLNMMRLRSGPQDLPGGSGLMLLMVLAYAALGMAGDHWLDDPDATPRTLLAIAVQFGAVSALLYIKKVPSRINQTVSALAGTGVLFTAVALFLLLQLDPAAPQPGLQTSYLLLFFWSLAVDGHIYRHALSIKMSYGVLVAVLIFVANFTLLRTVFG